MMKVIQEDDEPETEVDEDDEANNPLEWWNTTEEDKKDYGLGQSFWFF